MSNLDAALELVADGWAVFPIHSIRASGECSCGKSDCSNQGKHPRTIHGHQDATRDLEQVRQWWTQWPNANIGGATGKTSARWVLDIDPRHHGDVSFEEQFPGLEADVSVETGGGGRHLFFKMPDDGEPVPSTSNLAPGIDSRGDGGYVVLPPSNHVSGRSYEWEGLEFPTVKPSPAPPNVVRRVRSHKAEHKPAIDDGEPFPEGTRHNSLLSKAGKFRRAGGTEAEIRAALHETNKARCLPPLPDREVDSIAQSVARLYEKGNPRETTHDDWGRPLAQRKAPPTPPVSTKDLLARAVPGLKARRDKKEGPVPVLYPELRNALGGGLWPGVHVLVGATGFQKTQLALQMAVHAARNGSHALYVALETDDKQMAARLLGLANRGMWATVLIGEEEDDSLFTTEGLDDLPLWHHIQDPHEWSVDELGAIVENLGFPGRTPAPLVIVDFLQVVTDPDPRSKKDMRRLIGEAAYAARKLQKKGVATLLVSSTARENYPMLSGYRPKPNKERRDPPGWAIGEGPPERLVGTGKESGEIEYSADSVLVLCKNEHGQEYLAVAKSRAYESKRVEWVEMYTNNNGVWFSKETPHELVPGGRPKKVRDY